MQQNIPDYNGIYVMDHNNIYGKYVMCNMRSDFYSFSSVSLWFPKNIMAALRRIYRQREEEPVIHIIMWNSVS